MNKVILMGRLTADSEVRYTQGSESLCIAKGTIAVDRRGKEGADFPRYVAFGKTAEFLEKYGKKGIKLVLEGRLQTGSYEDRDGKKVYTTDVIVESVEFAESRKASEANTAPSSNPADGFINFNIEEGIDEELPFM